MTRTAARRRTIGTGAAVAVLAVLGACSDASEGESVASAGGRSDATSDAESEEAAPLDDDAQALVFAECMRDNGVNMPDPGPGQQGLVDAFQAVTADYDQAAMQEALSACEDRMPQFAQEEAHEEEDMLAFAGCLREQGLDVSDDPFGDIHTGGIDESELTAAMEVCRPELTGGGQ